MSNGYSDSQLSPRTLAGATILQIVPALREEPVARTAVNVAHALLQFGARAMIAADDGALVAELKAFGGEWVPLVNATINPFKLPAATHRRLEQLIAHERIDIVHAQSIGGGLDRPHGGGADRRLARHHAARRAAGLRAARLLGRARWRAATG